ncbi:MAG: hypothetical protein A2W04_03215 [Betaproteobacteria bacterium RBG_16_64_9]|nr:MAG: hypothetical protein A2W04_03215 [Betaproteobacteria bacterium RBG_16_64_9]OGA26521.1 MAG: hypothetical protein A3I01_14005 [Betaproteobacteria bacterium RIFCSPLOWO2_02_FULL_65_24]OGA76881.1 MAG: hypothetical protein A3G27_19840 [Betaproteobacteria bacterium RIFCSPLOWO2_12_FULL_66_14]
MKGVASGLGRRAFSLGTANAFDYALQFLLPVVLVRTLDVESFGEYRLLWLAVGTILAITNLTMPGSLYYFLPRSDAARKRLYINQTLVFLAVGGLLAAWLLSPWNPWLPGKFERLTHLGFIVPAFVLLWAVASLLDTLPTVDERINWQAKAIVGLSALRAAALSAAAIVTHQLGPVLVVLLGFVILKLVLLAIYIARHHGLRGPVMQPRVFADQLRYAAPFGVSSALHGWRGQADQWVAAALFPMQLFASFSVAAVLSPMVWLFRQSVNFVFLPSMSRRQSSGDVAGMLALNNRANLMVGALLYPLLALVFAFTREIVTAIYTESYVAAVPPMRLYILGMAAYVVEVNSIMLLLRQGPFAMALNVAVLLFSIALSWFAAQAIGLAGAAVGSVCAIYLERSVTLGRLSRCTGVAVRRLQDWTGLGWLVLLACLSGLVAWTACELWLAAAGPVVRLAAGGAILAGCYALLLVLSGPRRRGLLGLRPAP